MEIESECLQVVQFIRSSKTSPSYLGRVVKECRKLLVSLKDQNILFRFVKRSANNVAHYLARYSCSAAVAVRKLRMGNVHFKFRNVLLNDLKQ